MIVAEVGDCSDAGLQDHVSTVEPAAQTHLHHSNIDTFLVGIGNTLLGNTNTLLGNMWSVAR